MNELDEYNLCVTCKNIYTIGKLCCDCQKKADELTGVLADVGADFCECCLTSEQLEESLNSGYLEKNVLCVCPRCDWTGRINIKYECPTCEYSELEEDILKELEEE